MKKSELRQMIHEIVAEEIRQILPGVLSEMYLRSVAGDVLREEGAPRAPAPRTELPGADAGRRRLRDAIMGDEPPAPLDNPTRGIYEPKGPPQRNEVVNKLIAGNEHIYEGVQPIRSDSSVPGALAVPNMPQFGEEGIPVDKIPGFSDRMKELMGASSSPRTSIPLSPEAEERRLAEKRRKLDEMKVG